MNKQEIKEYMRKVGRKGGLATLKKHGKKHYKKIRKMHQPVDKNETAN